MGVADSYACTSYGVSNLETETSMTALVTATDYAEPNLQIDKIRVLPDGRVTRPDAAKFLGYRAKTLAEWQRLGVGPKSFKVGGRRFYRIEELKEVANGIVPIRGAAVA